MATTPTSATPTTTDDRATSFLVRFTADSVTTEQYDETIRRLEKSGDWLPEGLELHVAFEAGGKFRVSEIWDSQAQFDAFGKRLMPILEDVGIDPGTPEMIEIHNIIRR
ncbi:MAG TPA: hypothetical protein VJW23_16880 [Propionibacteriaceae bacterium]|nr:hypothetical protein [Propionibacteriaceae bacterium]